MRQLCALNPPQQELLCALPLHKTLLEEAHTARLRYLRKASVKPPSTESGAQWCSATAGLPGTRLRKRSPADHR